MVRSGTRRHSRRGLARAVAGARHLMGLGYPVHFLAVLSTSPRQPSRVFEMAAQVGVRHGLTRLVAVAPLLDSAARTLGPQALKEVTSPSCVSPQNTKSLPLISIRSFICSIPALGGAVVLGRARRRLPRQTPGL